MSNVSIRVRFAPSPTGQLHVGNVRTALFNWLLARGHDGTFIVRIEDTDFERSTEVSVRSVLDDLRWLGLTWDEGVEVGGELGPYQQSQRLEIYARHARELLDGGHAYYCFCSADLLEAQREAALAAGLPPKYAGTCRGIPAEIARRRVDQGEAAVVRLRVPEGREVGFDDVVRGHVKFDSSVIGDPVLVRSDGVPAYNFAVVVDDALMRVSHVIRGEDHLSNTPRQVLLYEAFGWTPPIFAHVSMVLGPDHTKLSKRHGAVSVAEFRARGYLPEALLNYLALIGWSPGAGEELLPLPEMARRFRLEDVGHSAGVFDLEKLAWVNRHYLKLSDAGRLGREATPFLAVEGWVTQPSVEGAAFVADVTVAAAASIDRLDQVPDRVRFLFAYDAVRALEASSVRAEAMEPASRMVVAAWIDEISVGERMVDKDRFRTVAARVRARTGQKGRALFHPLRLAVTGAAEGMELDVAVPLMERGALLTEETGVARIQGVRERLGAWAAAVESAS